MNSGLVKCWHVVLVWLGTLEIRNDSHTKK
jgi:hypothetical protein